jgi:type II secretory pathway component GspD/PulD (secretin)
MYQTLRRLFAIAMLIAIPGLADAASPVPATPAKGEKANVAAVRKALNEVTDMVYQSRSLNDLIGDLKKNSKIPVIIDSLVYQFGLDPNQPNVNLNLKQVKVKDGLKAALAPFNLKFGMTADGLFISTEDAVIARQLRQRVSIDCQGTEFATVVKELAADTGANLVVDPRLGDKAKKEVTLALEDVPLETAIRLLAEVSDLRAVRSSNVLFVTTAERAKDFRDDGPTSAGQINPFFPIVPDGGLFPPPGGIIGGRGGIGAAEILPPNPAVEAAKAGAETPPAVAPPPPPPPPVEAPPPPPVKKG